MKTKSRIPQISRAAIAVTAILVIAPASRAEVIYHWVDENGVSNYSQDAPSERVKGAKALTLGDDVLSQDGIGISEEDDPEAYQAHREEMDALWADIESRREERRNQRIAGSSRDVIYQYAEEDTVYPFAFPAYGVRPPHRPPHRPGQHPPPDERPEPRPSPPATLKRP